MDVSIVIPNFNGGDLLLHNIPLVVQAVGGYSLGKIEIIITDDASKDGSVEAVRHLLDEIIPKQKGLTYTILENSLGVNRGFSGNVNVGVKAASGDIVVLLNTDVIPKKGFLTPLLAHFKDEKVFAVGCMDESLENGKIVLRGRGIGKWERGFLHHAAGSLDSRHTLWVSGGSGAFRKSTWNLLGGLNELYNPFYWEDIDLSYRAQKAGYAVLFEKKSIVRHEHSKGTIKTFYKNLQVRKIAYRNQFLFTWLNLTDTMLMVKHLAFLPYHFIHAIARQDLAFFCGFVAAMMRIPKVISYRRNMEKFWKYTDKEITEMSSI